jgi:hypothetical protein
MYKVPTRGLMENAGLKLRLHIALLAGLAVIPALSTAIHLYL